MGRLVNLLAGSVLLAAGLLKIEALPEAASLGAYRLPLAAQLTLAGLEVVFGTWLLAGPYPRAAARVALTLFGCFLIIHLVNLWLGQERCGCFGRTLTHPLVPLLVSAVMLGLLAAWPPGPRVGGERGALVFFALWIAPVVAVGGWLAWTRLPAQADDPGGLMAHKRVVLEPETLVGKRCPLLAFTDVGTELARGSWVVVLYHEDCPVCRSEIPRYERLARQASGRPGAPRFALVLVPEPGKTVPRPEPSALPVRGSLDEAKEWYVRTPAALRLRDGLVEGVTGVDQEEERWGR
jgi:hypothetical protein